MILPQTGLISRHFLRLAVKSAVPFIFRTTLESLLASILAIAVFYPIVSKSASTNDSQLPLVYVVLIGPLVETIVFQTIPVWIAQRFTRRVRLLTLVGWIPFGVMHFTNNVGSGLVAGLAGGFFVGFSYAVWGRHSHLMAIGTTFSIHALSNLAWCIISAVA